MDHALTWESDRLWVAQSAGKEDAMKIRIAIIVLALVCLGLYLTKPATSPTGPLAAGLVRSPLALPVEVAALSGVWEGLGPGDLPARLVVEDLRENWAIVSYTWGDQPKGKFHEGWVRVRARVLPDGKLFWTRIPGEFTFQLSEDWTTLVGKREQGGRSATSLMRRVPTQIAMNPLATGGN
jgi:hypothetical protein